ncbi:patatin-like phospholipase family protein [Paraferrimonas sp. SM1919]|uniref:patatin-like phospholipase family protein n=1 Tax=Paraferrimonas sp. SM1919 TaxID=2662263 RepID=UPI0013D516A1|nr:patatin-like phospholipase family protein [Paraferrimonas sp. SM1919]
MLNIYAGEGALKQIQQQGIQQQMFRHFLGASGGPKWFTLFGLDKYLFGEFFKDRTETLNLIGSSAGAFRSACFAQNDPVLAISTLAEHYHKTVYEGRPSPAEITQSAVDMLEPMFGETGVRQILDNKIFKAHFIVAKCNGFVASENRLVQGLGIAKSLLLNKHARSNLNNQYQRFIFSAPGSDLTISDHANIHTQKVTLTHDNLRQALVASGSIPLVMSGIENILGAPTGMYRDGGIIDYHFDFEIEQPGLTLYPHFSETIKPGWFDKNSNRSFLPENYHNTVVVCPSEEFVASLPYQKIPDRKDFETMTPEQRIPYWSLVLKETERLAASFDELVQKQQLDRVKPIQSIAVV